MDILVELNDLAERSLTTVSRRPASVRTDYLKGIIALIKRRLHVRAASIFYEVAFENEVECLATTGVCDKDGHRIDEDDISNVGYARGEGLTGTCYQTGEPEIRLPKTYRKEGHPKYIEMIDGNPLRSCGTCFYPIPLPPYSSTDQGAPNSIGVIRSVHRFSPVSHPDPRCFDPAEIQKIAFIARQIGPVLHTLALRVQREQTIAIVKHDLNAPLNMMRDCAMRIESYIETSKTIKYRDLMNLKTSALIAQNLASQLDPDPSEMCEFRKRQTLLERDIVARLRNMLRHFAKGENGMDIRFDGFRDIPAIFIDRSLVERVLWNLLVNAIKYGTHGTTIDVHAWATSTDYCVAISNYGIGIQPEETPHIFKANYRSPRAAGIKLGLGLGLPIAKNAMAEIGGRLELTSPKDPTVFTIFFPNELRYRSSL